jgi:RNA polymerase sigma-70 factor (ECF subfamily)
MGRARTIIFPATELNAASTTLSSMHLKETATPDPTLLVLLAQTGDRAALEQLLHQTYPPLRRYITRLAGEAFAEDILQESSIQIFRKLPFLREPAVFRPWTFRIASRIAFSHLKHARRWEPLEALGEPPDEAFFALLDRVSPASRAVLLLHYQHDLSLEECAAILEIPVGTAKSRLNYGVSTLRKHLTAERKPA